jgi:cell division protein FtsQ
MMAPWFLGFSAKGGRRRRVVPFWRSRRVVAVSVLALVTAIAAATAWGWKTESFTRAAEASRQTLLAATAALGFEVREVFVVGRVQTPRSQLLKALGANRGAAIFGVDLTAARQRIIALPWVRDASVERVLPDTVVIRIIERKPVALWQRQGTFTLIDAAGETIAGADVTAFNTLLVIVGDGAPERAVDLREMLAGEDEIGPRVKGAVWVGRRRWDLALAGGITVRLPEQDPRGALHRLAAYHRVHRLLDRGVQTVDLRLADRVVIRRAPKESDEEMAHKAGSS